MIYFKVDRLGDLLVGGPGNDILSGEGPVVTELCLEAGVM